jgi:MoaA/NifB/PqqE/SkfB family radical SAM enzyme
MNPDLFEAIIRETHELGGFRVVLCGEGEPVLHPHFDRMLDLITKLEMEPYVITNGLAIDESRARLWADKKAHFRFSLQAGDEETWLRVHPGGTTKQFERLSRVIKLLAQEETPFVSTMHVIHKANFRQVDKMITHAHELGVREVLFRPVRAEGKLSQVILNADEENQLRGKLKKCLQLADRYGIHTNLREYLQNNLYIHSGVLKTADIYRKIPCYIGWIYAEFGLDGTMMPCLLSKIVMGHVGKKRIRDMWNSPQYQSFRREAISMPKRGISVKGCQCQTCPMVKYNLNIHNLLKLKSLKYSEA